MAASSTTVAHSRRAPVFNSTQVLPALSDLSVISKELGDVEELLGGIIASEIKVAAEVAGYTLKAGGKRLRPAFVILSARSIGIDYPVQSVTQAASAVELIHMASLIHDDVVDEAGSRRGRATANAAFGNRISVLAGDYLLAKSIHVASLSGRVDVIKLFSQVTVELTEGELLQLAKSRNAAIDEETYTQIIERKTARFIAGSCRVGAMLGGRRTM